LGNQLFQYACGRQLAIKRQQPLALDLSWFKKPHLLHSCRKFELSNYSINAKITSNLDSLIYSLASIVYLRSFVEPLTFSKSLIEGVDSENLFNVNDQKNIILSGYWQSESYFLGIRDILLSEISPKDKIRFEYDDVKSKIDSSESVAIHIRRGDYVSNPLSATLHGVLPFRYYQNAVNHIKLNLSHPYFFVFSDDIPWVKNHFDSRGENYIFIDGVKDSNAIEELELMRSCKHHIIANSSFSWWGAWLGVWKDQIVVSPRGWFADGSTPNNLLPKKIDL
jgi:hypothetical protein